MSTLSGLRRITRTWYRSDGMVCFEIKLAGSIDMVFQDKYKEFHLRLEEG
jgi:hypothetical protein